MNRISLGLVVLASALSIVACGGGGGGGPGQPRVDAANVADGLGDAGHLPGTVVAGNAYVSGSAPLGSVRGMEAGPMAAALSDDDRGLVVWRMISFGPNAHRAMWSQESSTDVWSVAQPVPDADHVTFAAGLILRMNRGGDAALGWVEQTASIPFSPTGAKVSRFIRGQGWDTASYDQDPGGATDRLGGVETWDLAMLDDQSFVTTVRLRRSLGTTVAALRTDISGARGLPLESPDTNLFSHGTFASRTSGDGLFYFTKPSTTTPGLRDLAAQIGSATLGGLGVFTVAFDFTECLVETYNSPIVAATSPATEGVLAIVTSVGDPRLADCNKHALLAVRVRTFSSISFDTTRLNSPDTSLIYPPNVAIDRAGNALMVWKETTGLGYSERPGDTYRLMWSQALAGQSWSTPAPLISNLGDLGSVPYYGRVALAMNSTGQAVAAVMLYDPAGSSLNARIVTGRFAFGTGWVWQLAANKTNLSVPAVAINESGAALLVYSALDVPRVGGKAATGFSNDPSQQILALRF